MIPPTFSHKLSRPSRQAGHFPQVMAPYITTLSPSAKAETPLPTAAISPEASAPTTNGSWRFANAMPRKPHRSRWLSATALTRIWTSPAPGGGGGGTSASSILRSAISLSARMANIIYAVGQSGRLETHHKRHVLPSEAERVRNCMAQICVARLIGHDVERNRRIWNGVIDCRGNALVLQRQKRKDGFDRSRRRKGMADHRFIRRDRQCFHALTKHGGASKVFHLVVFGSAGAMRVNVVYVVWRQTGVVDRVGYAANDRLAVRARPGTMKGIRHLATTFDHAEDLCSARLGRVVAFQYERARTFSHHETVAILGEWLGRGVGRVIAGRQRRKQ